MAAQATNRPLRLLMGQRERTWFQESRGLLSYRPWPFARGIVQANLVIIAFPLYMNPTTTSVFDIRVTTRYVSPAYPPHAAGARGSRSHGVYLLYAPLTIPLVYCHINSFQRASSLARPLPGGEKRTARRASHHEEL